MTGQFIAFYHRALQQTQNRDRIIYKECVQERERERERKRERERERERESV